ncbi:hypothetical protein C1I99_18420, partial [Micromonospora deserti]
MYGWTDPNDPDGAHRRAEPPHDEPAWLTDRPEPRSSYLFGDEPEQPGDEWHRQQPAAWRHDRPAGDGHRDQPTAGWGAEPADPYRDQPTEHWPAPGEPYRDQPTAGWDAEPADPYRDQPTEAWQPTGSWQPAASWQPAEPWQAAESRQPAGPAPSTGSWRAGDDRPEQPDDGWHGEQPTEQWSGALGDHPAGPAAGTQPAPTGPAARPAEQEPDGGDGRHRTNRRFSRPVLIGGAAAAATLVVSLSVAALALPDDRQVDPTAVDDTIAAAPAVPGTESAPADALASPSPS